jgi:hypothetical protein
LVRKHSNVKKDEFKWMTPICSLKFDNSRYPCECVPFWDRLGNVLAPEADCSKCPIAKEYGVIEDDEKDEE